LVNYWPVGRRKPIFHVPNKGREEEDEWWTFKLFKKDEARIPFTFHTARVSADEKRASRICGMLFSFIHFKIINVKINRREKRSLSKKT
jgi:hypothetical protein